MIQSPTIRLMQDCLQGLDDLLKSFNQNIGVVLLEGKHGAKSNSIGTAATNVDTEGLGLDKELVTLGVVECNEGTLALAAQVLEVFGILASEALKLAIQVVTDLGGVVHEVEALDFANYAAEEQGFGWVTHPGVELTVRLVGTQFLGAVVITSSLSLFGEGNHVGRVLEVPVLVSPEFAGGANTSLNLVDNQENIVLAGQSAQLLEESWASMVVTTLALNRLNDDSSRGKVPGLDQVLNLIQAGLFSLGILFSVLVERIFKLGEGRLGPVKGRNIQLVNRLGAGSGQAAEQAAVETSLEGQNRELSGARSLVVHGTLNLLRSEVDIGTTSLSLSLVHEGSFVGNFVGIGTGHGSVDIIKALGCDLEDTSLEDISPSVGREVAQGRTVDNGINHFRGLSNFPKLGVVVPNRNGGNLGIS